MADDSFYLAGYGAGETGTNLVVRHYSPEGTADPAFAAGLLHVLPSFDFARVLPFDFFATPADVRVLAYYIKNGSTNGWGQVAITGLGQVALIPTTKPNTPVDQMPSSAVAEGESVINNAGPANSCRFIKTLPAGNNDSTWGETAGSTPVTQGVGVGFSCLASILAVSNDLVLTQAKLYNSSTHDLQSSYYALFRRSDGHRLVATSVFDPLLAGLANPDGSFTMLSAAAGKNLTHLDVDGTATLVVGPPRAALVDDAALFAQRSGAPAVLVSDPLTRTTVVYPLRNDLTASQPPLTLETLGEGAGTDAGAQKAVPEGKPHAFEDSHGRLVVFHYRPSFDASPVTYANPHWDVRRYWR